LRDNNVASFTNAMAAIRKSIVPIRTLARRSSWNCSAARVEIENLPRVKVIDQFVQTAIGNDLFLCGAGAGNRGQPAAHLLLKTDDRHKYRLERCRGLEPPV
jgi:hypothetical protein